VISGILHVLKTGCRWRDVPASHGPPTTIYNRYSRWPQRRIWQRLFEKIVASGPVPKGLSTESSHVKARRSAAGSKWGSMKKRSAAREAVGGAKTTAWPTIAADRSHHPDAGECC
jgi:transposase